MVSLSLLLPASCQNFISKENLFLPPAPSDVKLSLSVATHFTSLTLSAIRQSTENLNATRGVVTFFGRQIYDPDFGQNCGYSCASRRKCVAAIECSCGESVGILRMFRIAPIPIPSESDIVGIPNCRASATCPQSNTSGKGGGRGWLVGWLDFSTSFLGAEKWWEEVVVVEGLAGSRAGVIWPRHHLRAAPHATAPRHTAFHQNAAGRTRGTAFHTLRRKRNF